LKGREKYLYLSSQSLLAPIRGFLTDAFEKFKVADIGPWDFDLGLLDNEDPTVDDELCPIVT
jgi:hypothetical protein